MSKSRGRWWLVRSGAWRGWIETRRRLCLGKARGWFSFSLPGFPKAFGLLDQRRSMLSSYEDVAILVSRRAQLAHFALQTFSRMLLLLLAVRRRSVLPPVSPPRRTGRC